MLTKFNENNHCTTFIKSLVTSACLPIVDCLQDGDRIIDDCCYIYHGRFIKCIVGGILDRRLNDLVVGRSYVNKDNSTFMVLDDLDFGSYHINVTRKETCPNSYYDADTHRLLGKWLRMLRSYTNIDLMSLYNCFDGTYLDDISIGSGEYYLNLFGLSTAKVLWVPIKYNTQYTIYVDSKKPVKMCPAFRNNAGMIKINVKKNNTAKSMFDEKYDQTHYTYIYPDREDPNAEQYDIHTDYKDKFVPVKNTRLSDLQFKKPFVWEGIQCDSKELYELQNYLGLIIQLDRNNTSSVVVLEGDRSKDTRTVFNSQNISWLSEDENENNNYDFEGSPDNVNLVSKRRGVKYLLDKLTAKDFNKLFTSPKQLTLINDNNTYAFNNKLIEYIVHHVITNMETIEGNIGRVQEYLPNDYEYEDIWDDRLRVDVYGKYMSDLDYFRLDVDGFINADVERYLNDNKLGVMK